MAGTSAQRHGQTELCSILNRAIREDDPNTTIHAVVFANAINMLLLTDDAPQSWLKKVSPKLSYPYVIVFFSLTAHLNAVRSVTESYSGIALQTCVCGRYPSLLEENIHRKLLKSENHPLSPEERYCCTWRGGGFRDSFKQFFERLTGKFYRVPGFLATSLQRGTAMSFLARANRKYPRILWCILVSEIYLVD